MVNSNAIPVGIGGQVNFGVTLEGEAYLTIAINGAGIAGPTLAFWLRKSGHEVVLIEESPRLRSGGYVIDFWGIGYDIAERMGLVPRIRRKT